MMVVRERKTRATSYVRAKTMFYSVTRFTPSILELQALLLNACGVTMGKSKEFSYTIFIISNSSFSTM